MVVRDTSSAIFNAISLVSISNSLRDLIVQCVKISFVIQYSRIEITKSQRRAISVSKNTLVAKYCNYLTTNVVKIHKCYIFVV